VARRYVFADESGTFVRSRSSNVSRYFYVGTLHVEDEDALGRLRSVMSLLRDSLVWNSQGLNSYFHASEDTVPVRRAVFAMLAEVDFRFDVTMVDKGKAPPEYRQPADLFAFTWKEHLVNLAPRIVAPDDELVLIAADLGTRKQRVANRRTIETAMRAANRHESRWILACWPSASDFTLQAADYCLWALQRRAELGDETFYTLIKDKVYTAVDVWKDKKWLEY
jgi:hypothetical protein